MSEDDGEDSSDDENGKSSEGDSRVTKPAAPKSPAMPSVPIIPTVNLGYFLASPVKPSIFYPNAYYDQNRQTPTFILSPYQPNFQRHYYDNKI